MDVLDILEKNIVENITTITHRIKTFDEDIEIRFERGRLSYLKYNDINYDAPLYDDGEGYGLYELSNLLNIMKMLNIIINEEEKQIIFLKCLDLHI